MPGFYPYEEWVFACPVIHWSNKDNIVLYYVSKAYNLNSLGQPPKWGRFMLGRDFGNQDGYDRVMLAEEPAIARIDPDFNVELYYLRLRTRVRLGKSADFIILYGGKLERTIFIFT